ncbi:hypothetical protein cypCar_00008691 [Cyprinus carpio]|nr:hypothetical protein cypCar_00008691 [Cyprinus carpio]
MESGERLASPSTTPASVHTATSASSSSSSSSSTAASNVKSSLNHGATASLGTCGSLFGLTGSDQPFSISSVTSVPSAYPLMAHPAFGLLSPATARPEFGGLGGLGVSAALAAHPQLGAFTEWWRAAEAHGRSPPAFFPPFLGLPPMFAPPLHNHEANPYTSKTPNKSSQASKGVNGAVNGRSLSPSAAKGAVSASASPSPALRPPEHSRTLNAKARDRKASHHSNSTGELQEKPSQRPKEKKARKKQVEGSGISESESGSSLDTDSDGVSSSDIDDLGEEEDDDDEEEDEQSKDSEESDSEKERQKKKKMKIVTPNSGLSKKEKTRLLDAKDFHGGLLGSAPLEPSLPVHLHRSPPPPGLSQPPLLSLSGSRARERPLHTSVIQSTGLAAGAKPLALIAQSRRDISPKHSPQHRTSSPNTTSATSKPLTSSPQPLPLSLCSSPKPLSVPSPPKSLPLSSSPKPPPLTPTLKSQSQASTRKSQSPALDALTSRKILESSLAQVTADYRLKQSFLSQDQTFPLQLKKQQDPYKINKRGEALMSSTSSSSSSSALPLKLSSEASGRTKPPAAQGVSSSGLPFSHGLLGLGQPNGVIQSSQEMPLALTTKPRSDVPVNLSTGGQSDSNSDSEMNGSEGGKKKRKDGVMEMDTDGEKTPQKLSKGFSHLNSSTNHSLSDCLPLNLQVIKPSGVATPTVVSSSGALTYHSSPSSSYSVGTSPGSAKRKRVMNEDDLRIPLEMGWQRETRMKTVGGRLQGDVAYYAPCGKRLRQYPDVVKYLSRYGITDITRDNFSFSAKIRVGDFYEAREGPQGLHWTLLKEEEVIPRILAMEGRRGRPPNSERQSRGGREVSGSRRRKSRPPNLGESEFPSPSEAKLLRKLEAQEIARQAAQMKLMRKLEKQALARAAKEARKQQAIMAAEERRKQKEQLKILKQQVSL